MSLSATEIARIDALLGAIGAEADPQVLGAALMRLLPDVPCRHCDASDVLEDPFRAAARADIHLLDAAGHCIMVTADPAEATALLIASKVAA